MVAAKEKNLSFKSGSDIEPMVNKPAHPTAAKKPSTVVNRISSYDFRARKFSKPPIGTSEKIHLIVHVGAHTKPRKYTGENCLQLRRLHRAPEMSLYRAYFVPNMVDPSGLTVVRLGNQNYIQAREDLIDELEGICLDCHCEPGNCFYDDCRAEAKRIAWSLYYTLKKNWLVRFPRFRDDRYKGRYCYEWAFGFEDAVNRTMSRSSDCFKVKVEEASTPNGGLQHFWINIHSECSDKEIFFDDGYWNRGIHCHTDRPCGTTRDGEDLAFQPGVCDAERDKCWPAEWYDHEGYHWGIRPGPYNPDDDPFCRYGYGY